MVVGGRQPHLDGNEERLNAYGCTAANCVTNGTLPPETSRS